MKITKNNVFAKNSPDVKSSSLRRKAKGEGIYRRLNYNKRSKRNCTIRDVVLVNRQIVALFSSILSKSERDFIIWLSNQLLSLLETRGHDALNDLLKPLASVIFQISVNSEVIGPLSPKYPKLSRKICRRFFRLYETRKSGLFLKAALTCLSVNTLFLGDGTVSDESLAPIIGTPRAAMSSYWSNHSLRARIRAQTRLYISRLKGKTASNLRRGDLSELCSTDLFLSSSAVNPASYDMPVSEYPKFDPETKSLVYQTETVRLSSVDSAESDAYTLFSDKETFDKFATYCKVTDQEMLLSLFNEALSNHGALGISGSHVNAIGFKADRKRKNRAYAKVNYWIQLALTGLHKTGYSLLDQDPCNFSYDHRLAFYEAVHTLKQGKKVSCMDESTATDSLYLCVYYDVARVLFGKAVADAWYDLISILKFHVGGHGYVQYSVGQPMGTKGSWCMYSIVSAVLDGYRTKGTNLPSALRVGDDSVFFGQGVNKLVSLRCKNFGVSYSPGKGCISTSGVEVVKCFYANGCEVTPIPANLLLKSRCSSSAWFMLCDRVASDLTMSVETLRDLALHDSRTRSGQLSDRLYLQRLLGIERYTDPNVYTWFADAKKVAALMYLKSQMKSLTSLVPAPAALSRLLTFRLRKATLSKVRDNFIEQAYEISTSDNFCYRRLARINLFAPTWSDEVSVQESVYKRSTQLFFLSFDALQTKKDKLLEDMKDIAGKVA